MRALRANLDGLLVEVDDLDQALALLASLQEDPPAGVTELVPAARTVLLQFDPSRTTAQRLAAEVRARDLRGASRSSGASVDIEVVYDGEDLAEVADLCDLSVEEVVARHTAPEYTVAFTGFAPGFGYLSGGDPVLRVPRRATPRTVIPAGTVAVAGEFSGIYPRSSPGGWRLLGSTDAVLFDLDRDPPALFEPGGQVRFVAVREHITGSAAQTRAQATPEAAPTTAAPAVPALEVLDPGGQSLLQDLGRSGVAALGVSPSGAMDRGALRRANRLVGNPPGTTAIETVLGGLTLRARGDVVVATAGATAPVTVAGRSVEPETPVALDDGETLTLGPPAAGVYTYLAVRGGLDVAPVLGSTSRDVLAGLGPAPLAAGDVLAVGTASVDAVTREPGPDLPGPEGSVTLDVVLGPRTDWCTPESLDRLTGQDWLVTPRSNRVGLRLEGAEPLTRRITDELPSEATVAGALQVPPSGQPVLFTADHPLTGGYPVIGCVATYHLDLAAQVPPGSSVRFRVVEPFADLVAGQRGDTA
ncbi:5-oxoprolinase/urea amidolyase family protein [Georgenia alba]|uniref:5-oxoprolinase/urea amidolyase family protein n=1 Tax=Georgenia alba TaxID=2233858 RepID=A0ABW2QC89_9MICO